MLKNLLTGVALALLTITAVHAQSPGIKRTVLQKVDVPGGQYEVVLGMAEIPAGASIGKHLHPGTEQGTVLEGEMTLSVDGQPDKTMKVGDSWQIPAGTPHDAKAGGAGVKVIAVYTVEKGKPLASPFQK